MPHSPTPRPRRRSSSVVAWSLLAVLLVGVAGAVWIGVRGVIAVGHLTAARATVAAATTEADDPTDAVARLADAAVDTSAARALTSDPAWRVAGALPWIGPQLSAVASTAAAIDDAASLALPPLSVAASALSSEALRPVDGAIDVDRIAAAAPAAAEAALRLRQAADDVAAIDRTPLIGRVGEAVSSAGALLDDAADTADALQRTTRLLPRMLGRDGPRTTLLLFQNNAEWRSLGGVVGAVAQLDADHGRIVLTAQGSSTDFAAFADSPVIDLPDDVRSIFDTRPARYMQNTTQVPDFAVGAQVAREMWRRTHGTRVDSVVAVDPVALSYLLRATGPVALPSGEEITADDAVPLLLEEVYRRIPDPAAQDAFFQSASAAVFRAVAEGRAEPSALTDALTRAGEERRLLVWNADADDQAVLAGSTLQGALPVSDPGRTAVGVYLNDGTGSKMDSYLHPSIESAWCDDGTARLHVELRNDAPDPSLLPAYVTGGGAYGVPVGDALTGVYVYLPPGAEVVDRRTSDDGDTPMGFAGGIHDGRPVVKWSVRLAPGRSGSLDLSVRMPTAGRLEVVSTPTRDPAETPRAGTCLPHG